jgi:hypothetical protein
MLRNSTLVPNAGSTKPKTLRIAQSTDQESMENGSYKRLCCYMEAFKGPSRERLSNSSHLCVELLNATKRMRIADLLTEQRVH